MIGKANNKSSQGQNIHAEVEYSKNEIKKVNLNGQAFIQPASAVRQVERVFEGIDPSTPENEIMAKIQILDVQFINVTAQEVIETVKEAMHEHDRTFLGFSI